MPWEAAEPGFKPIAQPHFWAHSCISWAQWRRVGFPRWGELRPHCPLPGLPESGGKLCSLEPCLSVCCGMQRVRELWMPFLLRAPPACNWSLCSHIPSRVSKTTYTRCSAWLRMQWGPMRRGPMTSTCCTQESKASPSAHCVTAPAPSGLVAPSFPGPDWSA